MRCLVQKEEERKKGGGKEQYGLGGEDVRR
jgi:hypothetical protein